MNEKVEKLIADAGAFAELLKIHYDQFIIAKFTKSQAFELTRQLLETQICMALYNKKHERTEGDDDDDDDDDE
jgi:hypothetical protein